jgi:hypothetical protein
VTAFDGGLAETGFKRARAPSGLEHAGVLHAFALDAASAKLVHLQACFQIISGDRLVQSYNLPLERLLLENTRRLHGVLVPSRAAELLVLILRLALKHASPIEVLLVNRRYPEVLDELAWLLDADTARAASALLASHAPTIEPALFERLLEAIATPGVLLRRVALSWAVAWRLRDWRRVGVIPAVGARWWRLLLMVLGRRRRKRLLAAGGAIVALVGPKAVGKSTLSDELARRLAGISTSHGSMPERPRPRRSRSCRACWCHSPAPSFRRENRPSTSGPSAARATRCATCCEERWSRTTGARCSCALPGLRRPVGSSCPTDIPPRRSASPTAPRSTIGRSIGAAGD